MGVFGKTSRGGKLAPAGPKLRFDSYEADVRRSACRPKYIYAQEGGGRDRLWQMPPVCLLRTCRSLEAL